MIFRSSLSLVVKKLVLQAENRALARFPLISSRARFFSTGKLVVISPEKHQELLLQSSADTASRKLSTSTAMTSNPCDGYFQMAPHTLRVPLELFAENRARLVQALKDMNLGLDTDGSVVLLQGGGDQGICEGDSSDVGPIFKQEGFFHWAFGVLEPDFYGAIDVATGKSILFLPRLPEAYAIVMGKIFTPDDIKEKYRVDEAYYIEDMPKVLAGMAPSVKLHTLNGVNTDSGKSTRPAAFDGISEFKVLDNILHTVMAECRVIKTEKELEGMRYASKISSDAHKVLMRKLRPGMTEFQAEAIFLHEVYFQGGARHVCYNCICGSGASGAVLHYGHAGAPNDRPVKDGDIVLFDMGAEYYRFCSDITLSYPVNGKFTEKQKIVYNSVYNASRAVIDTLKPGVNYRDMHLLANKVMLEGLLAGGLLQGNIEDMMKVNLAGRVFQPHGLGHFMGLDVHDVGGYLPGHPARSTEPGLRSLRTARDLKANMVLTVEPGCYFIDVLLDAALADPELSQFLVADKINQYRNFGGVRIEDDIIITPTGCEVMSIVPRTVEEIEAWMAGQGGEVEPQFKI